MIPESLSRSSAKTSLDEKDRLEKVQNIPAGHTWLRTNINSGCVWGDRTWTVHVAIMHLHNCFICWETIKIIAWCLPKLSSCLRNTSANLQFSCSKFKIFPENIFFPLFSPPLCYLFSRIQWEVGRGAELNQCSRWWIPLWTLSFLAECVQWARARSWNLANETHPPEGLLRCYWLTDRQRSKRLADGVRGICQSALWLKLYS